MNRPFCSEDDGKPVVTPDGDVIGSIVEVRRDGAYVTPKADLLKGCGSWLSGNWEQCAAFPLDPTKVEAIEDDRVVLRDASTKSRSSVRISPR